MTDLATRYIGTCVVCERKIRVRDNLLVHHGYKRPGDGYIYGDCFGVGGEPHEISDELARKYLEWLQENIPKHEELLLILNNELLKLEQAFGTDDTILIRNKIFDYKKQSYKLENTISQLRLNISRIENHVNSWSLKPLITFEEEIQNQELKKAEAAQVRADKKRVKLEAAVKRFQERIDSAYKRNNKEALANLYESICRKLYDIDNTLNKQERFRLVDRENVWKDLGVFKDGCYYEDYSIARDIITRES